MLTVERFEDLAALKVVRAEYERVYAADPQRTVFVSWPWMLAYLETIPKNWTVLAARNAGAYAGFLLLVRSCGSGPFPLYRELGLGAYPMGDYTSLIATGDDAEIVTAFAGEIERMHWDVLRARSVRDPRVAAIAARLGANALLEREPPTACHVVALPASWDAYVSQMKNGKQTLRYALRRRNAWSKARFTEADATTLEGHVDTLLRLHCRRWKGNFSKARRTYGRLFARAHELGCCRIAVLWDAAGAPIAAQAAFTDTERRTWGIYMLSYDRAASKHSPGIGMLMRGIERAIGERFAEYDFLRGDESYKTRFGSQLRWLDNYSVRKRSLRVHVTEQLWESASHAKRSLRSLLVGRVKASV